MRSGNAHLGSLTISQGISLLVRTGGLVAFRIDRMIDINSSEFCRTQADVMRTLAEHAHLPNVRARLLEAAASWDRNAALALRMERRIPKK